VLSSPRSTDTRPEVAPATGKDAVVPAPHPEEFRRRAVELARERSKPVAELAKELRISESCLRNWMAQADTDDAGSDAPRLTSKEKKELTELRRDKKPWDQTVVAFDLDRSGGTGSAGARDVDVVRP
jgi:transposase